MRLSIATVVVTVLVAIVGCMVTPAAAARDAVHGVLLAVIGLALVILAVALREAMHHRAIATTLAGFAQPAWIVGHAVGLVSGLDAAVVAGLQDPVIYCGSELPSRLDREELRAVILHERHHQLQGAPTRLVLLAAVAPFLRPWKRGCVWLERERARIEIAADAYAIAGGASRSALASALVKLSATQSSAGLASFATAADWRIRSLVGETTGLEGDRSGPARIALAGLLVAAICAAIYFW
jgi:hypothetical protein